MEKGVTKFIGAAWLALFLLIIPVFAAAQPEGLGEGLTEAGATATESGLLGDTDAKALIIKVINFILGLVGAIAVLALIYAGVSYITALGDEQKAERAKRMILYVLIGLALIILSAAIVNLVLTKL